MHSFRGVQAWIAAVPALALALSVFAAAPEGGARSRGEKVLVPAAALMERIRMGFFERRWQQALEDCDEYLRRYPSGRNAAWAAFYRGRALSAVGGREAEALSSYRRAAQLADDAKELAEEARRSVCQVALPLAAGGRQEGISALSEALSDPSRPVRVYAAVLASRLEGSSLLPSAEVVLRREVLVEPNADLRDEMTLALARIDPISLAGSPEAGDGERDRAKGAGAVTAGARWIHLRITHRSRPAEKVTINLPLSFARALLDSLPHKTREQMRRQAESQGLSWEALTTALDQLRSRSGPLLHVDDGDQRVEVWVD